MEYDKGCACVWGAFSTRCFYLWYSQAHQEMVWVHTLALHLHYLIFQHSVSKLIFFPGWDFNSLPLIVAKEESSNGDFIPETMAPLCAVSCSLWMNMLVKWRLFPRLFCTFLRWIFILDQVLGFLQGQRREGKHEIFVPWGHETKWQSVGLGLRI